MSDDSKTEIKSTGYTSAQISQIEHAFEFRDKNGIENNVKCKNDESGLLGFISVVKTLGEIHEAPEVAECLINEIKKGTYNYETAFFGKKFKAKIIK